MQPKQKRIHIGLRTIKTAVAVIIAMWIVDAHGASSSKLVFAMLGVVRSLTETDAQAVPNEAVFDSNSALTLRYGDVSVKLGSGEKLEMRVKKLAEVLPVLREGYAGVLHLESYDGSQSGLIFDSAK